MRHTAQTLIARVYEQSAAAWPARPFPHDGGDRFASSGTRRPAAIAEAGDGATAVRPVRVAACVRARMSGAFSERAIRDSAERSAISTEFICRPWGDGLGPCTAGLVGTVPQARGWDWEPGRQSVSALCRLEAAVPSIAPAWSWLNGRRPLRVVDVTSNRTQPVGESSGARGANRLAHASKASSAVWSPPCPCAARPFLRFKASPRHTRIRVPGCGVISPPRTTWRGHLADQPRRHRSARRPPQPRRRRRPAGVTAHRLARQRPRP